MECENLEFQIAYQSTLLPILSSSSHNHHHFRLMLNWHVSLQQVSDLQQGNDVMRNMM